MQYFKTAVSCRKADFSGLVVRQRSYYQKKRADNPYALWLRVIGSASVRLLFDNGYIELFYMDQGFLPTFRTE